MRLDRLVFRTGRGQGHAPLTLDLQRVTVFIGPNNGGKSRALQEIQHAFAPAGHQDQVVLAGVDVAPVSEEEFSLKLSTVTRAKRAGEDANPDTMAFEGRGGGSQIASVSSIRAGIGAGAQIQLRQYAAATFLRYFYTNLGGANRLQLVNPSQAEPLGSIPTSTISAVFKDDAVRATLSLVVKKAFDQYLVIDPTQMPNLSYMLSDEPAEGNIEKQLSIEAVDFFSRSRSVAIASDGTKAFIGILGEVLAGDPDVVFIDEPEAFLHPSLAYLLGQQIAGHAREGKQVFAATHSSSFLLGCVLSGANVDVVRLTFRNGVATARHLSASRLRVLMSDPLFRSVGAVSALFFESAIVVEGDSDRAFYDEVNSRLQRFNDTGLRHATFLNAHNKQTVVNIVAPLREIGIPAAFIFDLDWIKEDGQVWDRYFTATGAPSGLKEALGATRRSVRSALEGVDINYKRNGGLALLTGDSRATADAFLDQMEEYGLFTVRAGELETWMSELEVERTKSKWLPSVFIAMGSDPDDAGYAMPKDDDVWAFLRRVETWVANPNRRGMS